MAGWHKDICPEMKCVTRGSLAKQSDCFCIAKTKRPKRKMVLAAYNRKKILPRYPVNLKLYLAYIPLGPKISPKSFYLAWFRRYKQFKLLPFLSKIRKFKMAATFGKRKFF